MWQATRQGVWAREQGLLLSSCVHTFHLECSSTRCLWEESGVLSLSLPACLLVLVNLVIDACIFYLLLLLLRWPSSRCRQGIILVWHNAGHSFRSDDLSLKSLFSGAQLELVQNLLGLQHQGSVRGSLSTAFLPGCLCQLQGPCEAVRCLSVTDSLFHIFI